MLGCNLRALEFYSGIGGQHHGIRMVAPGATVVGAFEVHNVANDVYEHNFGWRPTQINLEGITAEALDRFKADIWLMSPPCQPFTRRGLQLHAADRRSASFLKLLELLVTLKHPPSYVLVENVVGFDKSPMRIQLHDTLAFIGLSMQEFLVTPLQLGVPYSRPRYYALGRRKYADGSCSFPVPSLPSDRPYAGPPGSLLQAVLAETDKRSTHPHGKSPHTDQELGLVQHAQLETDSGAIAPILEFLDRKTAPSQAPAEDRAALAVSRTGFGWKCQPLKVQSEGEQECAQRAHSLQATAGTEQANADLADSMSHKSTSSAHLCNDRHRTRAGLGNGMEAPRPDNAVATDQQAQGPSNRVEWVPQNVIQQWGQSLDIVGPESKRCNCFTKTYFRWVKGSGSVLATKNLHLVKERDSMHAWDLSDEGGIHEHSQFLHLKLRKTAKPGDSDRGNSAEGEVSLAAENGHGSQSSDDRACNLSTEDCSAQPYKRSGLTKEEINCLELRYFSPSEIARLHSFPEGFTFPKHVTLRQQYALLGNSVSALVIGDLLKYLLHGSESQILDRPVNS